MLGSIKLSQQSGEYRNEKSWVESTECYDWRKHIMACLYSKKKKGFKSVIWWLHNNYLVGQNF